MRSSILLGIALATISTAAMAAEAPADSGKPADAPEMHKMGDRMHKRMDEHMERMFKEMDSNNDGSISREESTAFGNKKFDERDANKDGKVTKEEWDAFRKTKMEEMKAKREKMMDKKDGANSSGPDDMKK